MNGSKVEPVCPEYESMALVSSTYSKHVHGYFSVTICILGGLSNVANIVVLTRRHMLSSTNVLLCAIAFANLLTMLACVPVYLFFYILNTVQHPIGSNSVMWMFVFLVQINFSMFAHTVAVWLTIILALFRYLFIAFPLRAVGFTMTRVNMWIAIVCASSAVVCIPNVLCNTFHPRRVQHNESATSVVYEIGEPDYIHDALRDLNFWVIAVFIRFIPCVLLTIFTFLLSFEMRKAAIRRQKLKSKGNRDQSQRRRESKTTMMLFAVVVSFLVIDLPQGILTVLNALVTCFYVSIYMPLGDFIDLLTLFQAVANFVLFTTMSQQFRSTFSSIFIFGLLRCFKCCRNPPGNINGNGTGSSKEKHNDHDRDNDKENGAVPEIATSHIRATSLATTENYNHNKSDEDSEQRMRLTEDTN